MRLTSNLFSTKIAFLYEENSLIEVKTSKRGELLGVENIKNLKNYVILTSLKMVLRQLKTLIDRTSTLTPTILYVEWSFYCNEKAK